MEADGASRHPCSGASQLWDDTEIRFFLVQFPKYVVYSGSGGGIDYSTRILGLNFS